MRISKGLNPSPAVIVAAIALAFAIGGTAFAGSQGLTSKINKASVKRIATKQITKAAPGLSVASANSANSADSPFARALIVDSPLTVTQARNVQQAELDNPRDGVYCLDLAFTPVGVQVTNETQGQNDYAVMSAVLDPLSRKPRPPGTSRRGNAFNACDPGTDLQVTAIDPLTGTPVNTSFFLEAWR